MIKLKRDWKDSAIFHFLVYLRYSEVNSQQTVAVSGHTVCVLVRKP